MKNMEEFKKNFTNEIKEIEDISDNAFN